MLPARFVFIQSNRCVTIFKMAMLPFHTAKFLLSKIPLQALRISPIYFKCLLLI